MSTPQTAADPHAERVRALAPLLASIAREIEERSAALEALMVLRGRAPRDGGSLDAAALDAQCAAHRRALRHAREELERLGCGIVATRPCVFCVSIEDGGEVGLVCWEGGAADAAV